MTLTRLLTLAIAVAISKTQGGTNSQESMGCPGVGSRPLIPGRRVLPLDDRVGGGRAAPDSGWKGEGSGISNFGFREKAQAASPIRSDAMAQAAEGQPPGKPKPQGAKQYVDAGPGEPKVLLVGGVVEDRILGNVNPWMKARKINFYWWMIHGIPTREAEVAQMLAGVDFDVIVFNEKGLSAWLKKSVTPDQYEQLSRSFVGMLKKNAPKAKLFWDNYLPAITPDGKLDETNNPLIVDLNKVIARIAAKEGISVNDFYSLMIDKLDLAKKVEKDTQEDRWAYSSYLIPSVAAVNSILKTLDKPALPPYTPGKPYDANK